MLIIFFFLLLLLEGTLRIAFEGEEEERERKKKNTVQPQGENYIQYLTVNLQVSPCLRRDVDKVSH